MSYLDVTGKTEEEALAKALAQLSLDRDDVSVEILERAKSGFLGIGSAPARVRVSYETAEEAAQAQEALHAPKAAPAFAKSAPAKPASAKPAAPAFAKPAAPAQKPAAPYSPSLPAEKRGEECADERAAQIRRFLEGLLQHLDCPAKIQIYQPEKGHYKVYLEGSRPGQLIGRRGETLDAIQQLTNYAVNRGESTRVRIHLDAENYREKREESLTQLAEKVAEKVVKLRHSVTLEPMNAYERHVVHTALQEKPHITTASTGTEPNRRVVVSYNRDKQ